MNTKEILDKLTDDELRHLHDTIPFNTPNQNRGMIQNILNERREHRKTLSKVPGYQYTPHMRDIWKLQEHITKLEEEITELYNRVTKLENPEIDILGTHARHVHSLRHPNPEYTTITSTPHVGE